MWTQTAMFGGTPVAFCQRCHRPLSNPKSTHRGIGPICYGKHRKDTVMNTNDITDRYLDIDLAEGIHLHRDEHGVATNVPHLVVHHSPTGFEWGYGGSGPADLALNIVEAILHRIGYDGARMQCYDGDCFKLSWRLHQDLKWQFIGPMPRAGGVIPYDTLFSWIRFRFPYDKALLARGYHDPADDQR